MAGSKDNPTDGFAFPDQAGDGRCGHDAMLSNDQATHLWKCHTGVFVSWLPSSHEIAPEVHLIHSKLFFFFFEAAQVFCYEEALTGCGSKQ